jgi:hypothetical protein
MSNPSLTDEVVRQAREFFLTHRSWTMKRASERMGLAHAKVMERFCRGIYRPGGVEFNAICAKFTAFLAPFAPQGDVASVDEHEVPVSEDLPAWLQREEKQQRSDHEEGVQDGVRVMYIPVAGASGAEPGRRCVVDVETYRRWNMDRYDWRLAFDQLTQREYVCYEDDIAVHREELCVLWTRLYNARGPKAKKRKLKIPGFKSRAVGFLMDSKNVWTTMNQKRNWYYRLQGGHMVRHEEVTVLTDSSVVTSVEEAEEWDLPYFSGRVLRPMHALWLQGSLAPSAHRIVFDFKDGDPLNNICTGLHDAIERRKTDFLDRGKRVEVEPEGSNVICTFYGEQRRSDEHMKPSLPRLDKPHRRVRPSEAKDGIEREYCLHRLQVPDQKRMLDLWHVHDQQETTCDDYQALLAHYATMVPVFRQLSNGEVVCYPTTARVFDSFRPICLSGEHVAGWEESQRKIQQDLATRREKQRKLTQRCREREKKRKREQLTE